MHRDMIPLAIIRPTCVGMNRSSSRVCRLLGYIRPTCVGMNRNREKSRLAFGGIRPTCVGMNRTLAEMSDGSLASAPRAWG